MWPFRQKSRDEIPTFEVDNTIGAGTRVLGDLKGPGGFRIDGTVEGAVDADGPVVIGERGAVEGSVRGREVVVLGVVRGDVRASGHLEIGPNGKVIGDVSVESFRMHKGGVFRGTSRMPTGDEANPTTLPFALPVAAIAEAPASSARPALEGEHALEALEARRGRTLPPPSGAVPPPSIADLPPVPAEAVSHERIVTSEDRATGT
ncbi:MAG: polymer-forming cytoskeletal protein [Labilithrix sp.]|nr:polymer-forming cytoskeletal protein [Labilithrix sp.]